MVNKHPARLLADRLNEIRPDWEWISWVDDAHFTSDKAIIKCRQLPQKHPVQSKRGAAIRFTEPAAQDLLADKEALENLADAMIKSARNVPEAARYPVFEVYVDTSSNITLSEGSL